MRSLQLSSVAITSQLLNSYNVMCSALFQIKTRKIRHTDVHILSGWGKENTINLECFIRRLQRQRELAQMSIKKTKNRQQFPNTSCYTRVKREQSERYLPFPPPKAKPIHHPCRQHNNVACRIVLCTPFAGPKLNPWSEVLPGINSGASFEQRRLRQEIRTRITALTSLYRHQRRRDNRGTRGRQKYCLHGSRWWRPRLLGLAEHHICWLEWENRPSETLLSSSEVSFKACQKK